MSPKRAVPASHRRASFRSPRSTASRASTMSRLDIRRSKVLRVVRGMLRISCGCGPDRAPAPVGHVGGDQGAEEHALRADERPHGELAHVDAEDAVLVRVGRIAVMLQGEPEAAVHGEGRAEEHDGQADEGAGHRDGQAGGRRERPHRGRGHVDPVRVGRRRGERASAGGRGDRRTSRARRCRARRSAGSRRSRGAAAATTSATPGCARPTGRRARARPGAGCAAR